MKKQTIASAMVLFSVVMIANLKKDYQLFNHVRTTKAQIEKDIELIIRAEFAPIDELITARYPAVALATNQTGTFITIAQERLANDKYSWNVWLFDNKPSFVVAWINQIKSNLEGVVFWTDRSFCLQEEHGSVLYVVPLKPSTSTEIVGHLIAALERKTIEKAVDHYIQARLATRMRPTTYRLVAPLQGHIGIEFTDSEIDLYFMPIAHGLCMVCIAVGLYLLRKPKSPQA